MATTTPRGPTACDPATALTHAAAQLERDPADGEAWALAAEALIRLERPIEALAAARRAHRPALLAWALARAGEVEEALRWLEAVPEPADARTGEQIARAYDLVGWLEPALRAHRQAVERAPDEPGVALRLAERLERSGLLDEASDVVAGVLERAPGLVEASRVRVRLRARTGDVDGAAAEARALLDRDELADEVATGLMLELGRIEVRRGRPKVALTWATAGNRRALERWVAGGGDPDGLGRQLAELATAELPQPPRSVGTPTPEAPPGHRGGFVVGFPRSGTTLVQRMLAGHPAVATFDEAPLVDRALDDALPGLGWADAARAVAGADAASAVRRAWWFGALRRLGGPRPGPCLVVDKLPLNLLRLDVIVRAMPEAPIVLVVRDPRDALVSALFQDFRLNQAMAQLTDPVRAARLYDRAMATWERVAPANGVVLRYEALLDDPEGTWRPVVDALGLPWNPAILGSRATDVVRLATPSYAAVRKPLDRSPVGRWRAHADDLAEAFAIVEPWVRRFGY